MDFVRKRRRPKSIDMSPLIDCVFQLLVFFMLSSSFLAPTLRLTLPQAKAGENKEPPAIMVTADEHGALFVNSRPVTAEALQGELQALLAGSTSKVITFRGDEQADFKWFVHVLDTARAAGAIHINIAHRPKRP